MPNNSGVFYTRGRKHFPRFKRSTRLRSNIAFSRGKCFRPRVYIKRAEDAGDLPLPRYMTENAAGMDLRANVHADICMQSGGFLAIPVGIHIALPKGFEAQIRPRSGLAMKFGVTMVNAPGTIDADYRGEIHVILINHGAAPFVVRRGDRIAQMVVAPVVTPVFIETDELPGTERGAGGFGHTGV